MGVWEPGCSVTRSGFERLPSHLRAMWGTSIPGRGTVSAKLSKGWPN